MGLPGFTAASGLYKTRVHYAIAGLIRPSPDVGGCPADYCPEGETCCGESLQIPGAYVCAPEGDVCCTQDTFCEAGSQCCVYPGTDSVNCCDGTTTFCCAGTCTQQSSSLCGCPPQQNCEIRGTSWSCCNGECRDTSSDPSNCGACGVQCSAGQVCCASQCCDLCCGDNSDVCTSYSDTNCGACARKCSGGQVCSAGATCACPEGTIFCDATCCPAGESCCSDSCTALASDPNHCGSCVNKCSAGQKCCNGICCGGLCCGGECTPFSTNNCSDCGVGCNNDEACCKGRCCSPGYICGPAGDCIVDFCGCAGSKDPNCVCECLCHRNCHGNQTCVRDCEANNCTA
jgi:hypothetical protein